MDKKTLKEFIKNDVFDEDNQKLTMFHIQQTVGIEPAQVEICVNEMLKNDEIIKEKVPNSRIVLYKLAN